MKKISYILFLLLFITACEQSIDAYNDGEDGIYFDTNEIYSDTIRVAWGLKNSDVIEQKIKLHVRLIGNTADHDRKFTVDIVKDSETTTAIENIDYRPFPLEYAIPANGAETFIEITLLRAPHLVTEHRNLTVKLNETPELKFIYSREMFVRETETYRPYDLQRVIKMTEAFPIPRWWSMYGNSYFGTWTATKSILICDVMGIDRETWVGDLVGDLTQGYLRFVGQYMHRWLQENPTLDEDGNPMEMGASSQI